MPQDKYSLWEGQIAKTAKWVSKDFPEVDEEDLYNDLVVYVFSNQKLTDPKKPGVATGLYREARKICWNYRKQALHISAQYSYRTSDVRKILDTLFQDEESQYTYLPEDQRSFYDDDRLATNSDIRYAYSKLPEAYQKTIYDRFALKLDVTNNRLYPALGRMCDILNTYNKRWDHEGPGTRKLMSNAREREIIGRQNGDWED